MTGRANPGLGVNPLAHPDRLLKEGVEDRANCLMRLTKGQRALDLSENLALTDHQRVKTGRHREPVGNRTLVEEHRTQGPQLTATKAGNIGEDLGRVVQSTVKPGDGRVDLGAVAGGQDHCLVDVLGFHELFRELGRSGLNPGPADPDERPKWTCGRR